MDAPGNHRRLRASPLDVVRMLNLEIQNRIQRGAEVDAGLHLVLARALLAADAPSDAIEELASVDPSGEHADEAAALLWVAHVRMAEATIETDFPPTGPLADRASRLAQAWLGAHVTVERGALPDTVSAAIDELAEEITAAGASESGFDHALSRVLMDVRCIDERPPAALLAKRYRAALLYRVRRFEEAYAAYARLAAEAGASLPAQAHEAGRATTMIARQVPSVIVSGTTVPTPEAARDLEKAAAPALRSRDEVLLRAYQQLAGSPRDADDDIKEIQGRLSSIVFADSLTGAIDQALAGAAAAGHALLQQQRWTSGLELLLASSLADEVERGTERLQRIALPDSVYTDVAERWRLCRNVPGAEGAYAALADWLTPVLDPNAPENQVHFDRLGELARSGPVVLTAVKALGRTATLAAGERGRRHVELLADLGLDRHRSLAIRRQCLDGVRGYLDTWFDDDELPASWLDEFGQRLADTLLSGPRFETEDFLVVLGMFVAALRRADYSTEALLGRVRAVLDQWLPENVDKLRDRRRWLTVMYGLDEGATRSEESIAWCFERVRHDLETARHGRPRLGVGVIFGNFMPVACLGPVLREGTAPQRQEAGALLVAYARDTFLSDRHRLVAINQLWLTARNLKTSRPDQRAAWAELALEVGTEPVLPDPSPFHSNPWWLQLAAALLLAACKDQSADHARVLFGTLWSARSSFRPAELGLLLRAFGQLHDKLHSTEAARVLTLCLRESAGMDPQILVGAWAGLTAIAHTATEHEKAELESVFLDALRDRTSPMVARQTLVLELASLVRDGLLPLKVPSLGEIMALALEDPFWVVRYHGGRLKRHLGRLSE